MSEFVIRTSKQEDNSQLLEIMNQYIVDFYKRPKPAEEELRGLIQFLHDSPSSGKQFVAEKDGKLLGFATLYFTFSTLRVKRSAILNDLFIVPEARGQKLGEKLFQACLSYTRDNDFTHMTWETARDNVAAQSLYEKMGGQLSEWLVYEME